MVASKSLHVFTFCTLIGLSSCSSLSPRSAEPLQATPIEQTPESILASQQLASARHSVAVKDWPTALAQLQSIIDIKTFQRLPSDLQYQALSIASRVAIYHGPKELGYGYLRRVIAMPQADFADWREQLHFAERTNNIVVAAQALKRLLQRWPDRTEKLDSEEIREVVNHTSKLPSAEYLTLLKALFDAQWKAEWGIEPSATWRDLTLLLLQVGRLAEANEVTSRITDVYVLIEMRSDRRFDRVVEANATQFDIVAASDRELRAAQSAVDTFPKSLAVRTRLIVTLINQRRYEAALAAADAVMVDIRSSNFPDRVFVDYGDELPLFLNYRAEALERVGRWDEAVEQLTAASRLHEKYSGNVDELVNLGELYADLGRPQDALGAIDSVLAKTSPFGAMQLESVRLDAAFQLGDSAQVARSLKFLEANRADAPSTYVYVLLTVNQADRAATALIEALRDPAMRRHALLLVQEFAATPETPREVALDAALQSVIARTDVQNAIRHVGRVNHYNLEPY